MRHYLPADIVTPNDPVPVVLVGAGGTGGRILVGLAQLDAALRALGRTGLEVHVFDGDEVGLSNVGRQVFFPPDVGRNKATCLVTRVNMSYGLNWRAYPQMLPAEPEFRSRLLGSRWHRDKGIIITAVDSAPARKHAHKALSAFAAYWLDTGNTRDTGQVVLGTLTPEGVKQPTRGVNTPTLPHVLDLYPDISLHDNAASQGPSCSVAQALERQDLFINQWVANAALSLLWQGMKVGYLEHHGAFINLSTLNTRPLKIDPTLWARMGYASKKGDG